MLTNKPKWSARTRRTALVIPIKPHFFKSKGRWKLVGVFGLSDRAIANGYLGTAYKLANTLSKLNSKVS